MDPQYYAGTVMALLPTEFVTPITRQVLAERMVNPVNAPVFFNSSSLELLSIVCDRLVAQESENRIVNIAELIDHRLHENTCDGWRYNNMPPDGEMYLTGLTGIEESSTLLYKASFLLLDHEQQLMVLTLIQEGRAAGEAWKKMSSKLFFEELLAETTEIFYSHPLVQEEIGYVGMADAKGWTKIGLNEKDLIEPGEPSNEKAIIHAAL